MTSSAFQLSLEAVGFVLILSIHSKYFLYSHYLYHLCPELKTISIVPSFKRPVWELSLRQQYHRVQKSTAQAHHCPLRQLLQQTRTLHIPRNRRVSLAVQIETPTIQLVLLSIQGKPMPTTNSHLLDILQYLARCSFLVAHSPAIALSKRPKIFLLGKNKS